MKVKSESEVAQSFRLFATLWAIAHQVHGILQARIRNGLPFPSSEDLANPGTEPASLMSPALAGGFFTTRDPWEAPNHIIAYSFFRLASISNMYLSFLHVSSWIDSFFLVANTIPSSGCTIVYLSIHLVKDSLVVYKFWQL